jgi:hypothetical protein
MRLDDLRQELRDIADEAPPSARDARSVIGPAVRRRWTRRIVASVVTLAVVSGAVATVTHDQHHARRLSIAGSGPPGTTPSLSPATIANGRWSAIAPFPLATRTDETTLWTGSQLIVWGGDNGQRVFGDGAAYDPDTDTWRVLPPAPIAARTFAAVVWTGREMIVWGGDRAYVGNYASDGAAFDPVAWKWRPIAAAPLTARYGPDAVWTGTDVIVFGGSRSNSDASTLLDAAAYDPATDRWKPIAPMPGVNNATVETLSSVWTGSELFVWEFWTGTVGNVDLRRQQLVEYDPSADSWRPGPQTDNPHRNVYAPIWTGSDIVSTAEPPLCDLPDGAANCGPPPTNLHADELDPASGMWRSIPHGPADDGEIASVWTGDELVVVSGQVIDRATGKTTVEAGTAADWNPDTNAWTALPRAPFASDVATGFWTGSEILIWGSARGVRYDEAPTAGTFAPTSTPVAPPATVAQLPA